MGIDGIARRQVQRGHPRRTAPYEEEPGFSEAAGLWLFGNARLLHGDLACVPASLGPPDHLPRDLDAVSEEAERLVLAGKILVCGVHSPAHRRAAVVPLKWGSPRILAFSGGFRFHLGPDLDEEPFEEARRWRHVWDPATDLAVSRRAPEQLPTYVRHNPSVDRLVLLLAFGECPGIRGPADLLTPIPLDRACTS
ncbi:MAG: hypothetical protein ACO1SV_07495 [Fimbriimonas sp.]